jgi:hypothetical protein
MHFRGATLIAQLEVEEDNHYGSLLSARISAELEELDTQMANLEDDNEEWLPERIAEEFKE